MNAPSSEVSQSTMPCRVPQSHHRQPVDVVPPESQPRTGKLPKLEDAAPTAEAARLHGEDVDKHKDVDDEDNLHEDGFPIVEPCEDIRVRGATYYLSVCDNFNVSLLMGRTSSRVCWQATLRSRAPSPFRAHTTLRYPPFPSPNSARSAPPSAYAKPSWSRHGISRLPMGKARGRSWTARSGTRGRWMYRKSLSTIPNGNLGFKESFERSVPNSA
jgi:hypothetical protein